MATNPPGHPGHLWPIMWAHLKPRESRDTVVGRRVHSLGMAMFLTTTGVSHRLEEIIKNAEERLVLISPYLKVNSRLRDLLEHKNLLKVDIRVVYGKKRSQSDTKWLKTLGSVKAGYCANLHAKCYMNEKEALITSMNLHEFSQVNNEEMGILVERTSEPDLYDEIRREAMRLVQQGKEELPVDSLNKGGDVKKASPKRGYCIRCATPIPLKPQKPYCQRCYTKAPPSSPESGEQVCHVCGKRHPASLRKPACLSCYREHKSDLRWPRKEATGKSQLKAS